MTGTRTSQGQARASFTLVTGLFLAVLAVLAQVLLPALHALTCTDRPVELAHEAHEAQDEHAAHVEHDHAPHGGPLHFDPVDSFGLGDGCAVCDALAQLPVAIAVGPAARLSDAAPLRGAPLLAGSSAHGRRAAPPSARAPPHA